MAKNKKLTEQEVDDIMNKISIEVETDTTESSPYEIFMLNIADYNKRMTDALGKLKKDLPEQEALLDAYSTVFIGGESFLAYQKDLESRRKIVSDIKKGIKLFEIKLGIAADAQKFLASNYDKIVDLNTFLNNPLGMQEFNDLAESISKMEE